MYKLLKDNIVLLPVSGLNRSFHIRFIPCFTIRKSAASRVEFSNELIRRTITINNKA